MATFYFPNRTLAAHKLGSAAGLFNGVDDVVTSASTLDHGTGNWTASVWFKEDSFANLGATIGQQLSGQMRWHIIPSATGWKYFLKDSLGNQVEATKAHVFSTGIWYHLVMVVDRSNDLLRLYVDGNSIGTVDISGLTGDTGGGVFQFGRSVAGASPFFDGALDEVAIWDRVLSGPEIATLYVEQNTGTELASGNALWDANLLFVWHMNHNWLDAKGSNDGTRLGTGEPFGALLTISFLETRPKPRPNEKFQSRDVTPAGVAIVYDLLTDPVELLTLLIRDLTSANKIALVDFIEITVNWASDTFDFDDDRSNQFNGVRFWFDEHDFRRPRGIELFNEDLVLRVDP